MRGPQQQTFESATQSASAKPSLSPWLAALRALRPVHWAKNVLLFAAPVLAHDFSPGTLLSAMFAFVAFSLCASAVYLVNDLVDRQRDRNHPIKRHRPIASGSLPTTFVGPMVLVLLAAGLGLSVVLLPALFVVLLLTYLGLTTLYSLGLKQKMVIDVILLAGLYTLRIVAGGAATGVRVSEWLLAFSMFLFLSLAFAKRYAELARLSENAAGRTRGYLVSDLGLIESLGPTSGYLTVLVLALYINSDAVQRAYHNPAMLWLMCPLLLYWITRLWFLAKRRVLNEDPVVFAVTDGPSLASGLLAAGLLVAASWT